MTIEMRPEVLVAATKAAGAKTARGALSPGEYRIDAVVRLLGRIRVGEDGERRVASAVPWQRIALAALGRLSGALADAAVRQGLDRDEPVGELPERLSELVAELTEMQVRSVRGSVTGQVEVLPTT